jgi:putative ABC transport system ATP-binding protein
MLKIEHISKTFNPRTVNEKKVLSDLSLTVNEGDFISIIGANGAGKSTLFNVIAGTFLTDEGSIFLDGEDITMTPAHVRARYIGRLFQDPLKGTAPDMSIEENLALAAGKGGWLSRISKSEKRQLREKVALLGMGLEDRMDSPVGLLSGGQRQALTLMMATINPPRLLLLDEHTAALDPETSAKVMELTENIAKENRLTCLVITHNMQSALAQGNRTLMMDQGSIIFDIGQEERQGLTVDDLLNMFRERRGHNLDNDRMLLSGEG